jgi:mono/diheme cytochrome c family protein
MDATVTRLPFAGTELQDIVAYIRTASRASRGEPPLVVGVPDRGQRLFVDKGCAACHAVDGRGSGPGPSIGPRSPRAAVTDLPVVLWNHRDAARARRLPRLTGQDMADITAYLHAAYYFDPPPGDARQGRRRLEDKGCLGCHSIYGIGVKSAPDFASSNVMSSKLGQLTAMWNHGPYMENDARRRGMTLPRLTAQELSDITTYLAGLAVGPGGRKPR